LAAPTTSAMSLTIATVIIETSSPGEEAAMMRYSGVMPLNAIWRPRR
jgi:hypothetical protein